METTTTDLLPEDKRKAYLLQRMDQLGITPKLNRIELYNPDAEHPMSNYATSEIFSNDENGNIKILVYTIDAQPVTYLHKSDAKTASLNASERQYYVTRLREPYANKKGDTVKYLMPKNQGTYPFFPPNLVEAYKKKHDVHTLVLTEGYFKAFKAGMHGFYCVGLPSITCLKSRENGELHPDIKKLIETCKVKRIVWLHDGDAMDLTNKIDDDTDLYKRPLSFFRSVQTFYELLHKYDSVNKYYAYVNTANIDGHPKGLDDLLAAVKPNEHDVLSDLTNFERFKGGKMDGAYFVRYNLEIFGLNKIRAEFLLHDVNMFYLHHRDKNPKLEGKEFIFNGTRYKYDSEKQEVIMIAPGEAKSYFMVGNDFYKHITKPDKYGKSIRTYENRSPAAIAYHQNLGKKEKDQFFRHIPKYETFCCVPDHVNYQQVINSCFNMYHPFQHEPEEGDCTITLEFIKHIFGDSTVKYKKKGENTFTELRRWELALDYLQLLYQRPQQILPILCLVSEERQTGKTTLANWLARILSENMAIVGNADFKGDFNAHWSNKVVIACDETYIDKKEVVEKLKSLSTSDKIMMNAKGKQQVSMEFFGKFILLSNNEKNFIYSDENEIRFWVIKVHSLKGVRNVDLLADMEEEIPAFLHFLNSRQMATEKQERHWFNSNLLKTDALEKIIEYSKPTIVKEIRNFVRNYFMDFREMELHIDLRNLAGMFPRLEHNYLERVLEEDFKLTRAAQSRQHHYRSEEIKSTVTDAQGEPHTIIKRQTIEVHTNARHFVFLAEHFLTPEEMAFLLKDVTEPAKTSSATTGQGELPLMGENSPSDDLPF